MATDFNVLNSNWSEIQDYSKAKSTAAWQGIKARDFAPLKEGLKLSTKDEFKHIVKAHWQDLAHGDEFINIKPQVAKDSKLFGWFAKAVDRPGLKWANQSLINIPGVKNFAEKYLGAEFGSKVIQETVKDEVKNVTVTTVKATSESAAKNVAVKTLSKVPVVGVLIDYAFRIPGIADTFNKEGFKAGTEKAIEEAGGAVGSTTGFFAGMTLAAGIGTAICPGIGTVAGAVVGFVGGLIGSQIGNAIGQNVSKIVSKPVGWMLSLFGVKDKPKAQANLFNQPLQDYLNNPYIQNPNLLLPNANLV